VARVRSGRRTERAGVNALRSLLEAHDHLVQEIDGGVDHDEDLFLMLVRKGYRTGHVAAIQVKSGRKYKRAVSCLANWKVSSTPPRLPATRTSSGTGWLLRQMY